MEQAREHFKLLMHEIINELNLKVESIDNKIGSVDDQKMCRFIIHFETGDNLEVIMLNESNGVSGWFKDFFEQNDTQTMFTVSRIGNAIGQKIREREDQFWSLFQQY